MTTWIDVCAAGDIAEEDVLRYDRATDGLCTHEKVHLAEGLVMDHIIECPKHNGRFDYRTGAAKGAPVCVDLMTYPVKVEGGRVLLGLG
jgi:3-phenylpropionate/trans-cinnamate dioxygenase ferredoxin component